jgi:hypothetical protein
MKNPWSARDSERLAWKAIDLAVDAVMSLNWIRDLKAIDILAETRPPPAKALRQRTRSKRGKRSQRST